MFIFSKLIFFCLFCFLSIKHSHHFLTITTVWFRANVWLKKLSLFLKYFPKTNRKLGAAQKGKLLLETLFFIYQIITAIMKTS